MSGFLFRTTLNSTRLLLSRIQISNPSVTKLAVSTQQQSITGNSSDGGKLNLVNLDYRQFFSTKTEDTQISSLPGLEQKALEIIASRNSNPYNIFLKEKYKSTAESNPNASNRDIFGMLASSWRSMTFEEKMKYVETARENQKQKKLELESFFTKLSEKDVKLVHESLKQKRSQRRKELSKYRLRQEKKSFKKPNKPPGPFFLYCKTLDRGEADIKEFIKGASMKWKALAQEDKQKFFDQNKALEEEYQTKLGEWETRMVSEGRVKLVRAKFREMLENKLVKPKLKNRARGIKLARSVKLKKLRLLARRAAKARRDREKKAQAKQSAKSQQAKIELAKAKKLIELASKLKLNAIKKTLNPVQTSKKPKAKVAPKFKDDEIVEQKLE